MRRPRLWVQHCVVNMTTRQYGPHPTSDLLGVDYTHPFPADAEFPRVIHRLDLFVRFYTHKCRPMPIEVRVHWLRPSGSGRRRVNTYHFNGPFGPMTRVVDHGFRLANVLLPGRGMYTVGVYRPRRHKWRGQVWQRLAFDTFEVE